MTAELDQFWTRIADGPSRLVIDEHGRHWTVYEMKPPAYDRRCTNALVFEGDASMRKVRQFPQQWFELPHEELLRLADGI